MNWEREIADLHRFFEQWFKGEVDSLDRVEAALDPGFTIVGPGGGVLERSEIIEIIARDRGQRPDLRISTTEHRLLDATDDRLVTAYVEEHHGPDGETRRHSTAIFAIDEDAPNGVRWIRVHETWTSDSGRS